MRYLSVCSGIEAASVAWEPLGWSPVAFSEIEPFPSAVLAHHFPSVPNWGDMTKFQEWPDANVDVLVGGTPCQSFSVAGLRKGLADPRGNLALTYLAIADRYRPRWIVWENVPGVLSSNGGRDFGAFLGGLGQLGYGFSYRVLDAQYVRTRRHPRAVPQRRRRVFVVGHLGDWRPAAAVLFDRESLSGNPPPRRETGASVAALTANGVGTCGADDNQGQAGHLIADPVSHCLTRGAQQRIDWETESFVAHTLKAEGFDASEDGTGRGTPLVPVARAYRTAGDGAVYDEGDATAPLTTGTDPSASIVTTPWAVRRLTPTECERLQGFPDGWTQIPWRGKPADACPDGPRYRSLGNSMAVNVMTWLGERIARVDRLRPSKASMEVAE